LAVVNVARPSRGVDPRGEVMLEPDEVSAMLRLKQLGWGDEAAGQGVRLLADHEVEIEAEAFADGRA
jgi:hypothetical protein